LLSCFYSDILFSFLREEPEINYLKFTGWLFFMTWIASDTVPRYILPRLESVYDALEDLSGGAFCAKNLGVPLSLTIQVILSVSFAYILTIWPVWCVLRYFTYTKGMDAGRWLYALTGFLCCEYALGKMAKAYRYRSFFMSVFHYTFAMGAYVVFIINPTPAAAAYPWLIRLVSFEF